ncbi:MAG TPA: hypothetical protein VJA21_08280 [Verrucomicrobiae bacterium]
MPQKRCDRVRKLSRKAVRDLDTKISFLEGVVRRDPGFVEALQTLGDHYSDCGRYEESLTVDQKLSELAPRDPLVFYNLACSYSLNRKYTLAASALNQALLLGYRDFKWLVNDPDLDNLRKHPAFRGIEERIRRMKIKIT